MTIRVAIVEDDEQVRETLATLINATRGFECVGTHPSGEHLLETPHQLESALRERVWRARVEAREAREPRESR